MEFIAGLPQWAIYGLVGGAIGAVLGAVGWWMERRAGLRFGRFLPLLTLAITGPVSERLVMPSLEPYRYCAFATDAQKNTPVGQALDDYTTFDAMHVNCPDKSIIYDMTISIASTDIVDAAGWDTINADLNGVQCSHATWRKFIAAGWTISNDYRLLDGMRKRLTASCK